MENKSPGTTKVQTTHHNNKSEKRSNNKIKEEEELHEEGEEAEEIGATAVEAAGEEDEEEEPTDNTSSLTPNTSTSGPLPLLTTVKNNTMMISSSTSTPVGGVGNLNHESPGGNNHNNNISPTIVSPNNNSNGSSNNGNLTIGPSTGGIVGGVGGLLNGGSPDSTTHNSSSSTASTSSGFHSSTNHHHHRSSTSSSASNNTNGSTGGAGTGTGNTNNQTNMYSLKWNTQLLALQRSLANLWDNGIGTDAVLLCQGVPLPVHKIILTAASPYVASVVQTMVGSAHMMPVIVLDISAEAGKALLSFLYCGEAHVPVTIIPQLVSGAKFLGISGFGEPGVIESLTGMVPEQASSPSPSQMSSIPEKSASAASSFRSTDSPCFTARGETDSPHPPSTHNIPQMQLPVIPSIHGVHVQIPNSVQYQLSSAAAAAAAAVQTSNNKSKSSMMDHRAKNNSSPYPSQQYIENLIKNGGTPGATITKQYSNSGNANSKKNSIKNRVFIGGGTSILDNLLKNPKGSAASRDTARDYSDSPVNLSSNKRNNKDNDISQYEAQGYADNAQQRGFYYSPSHGNYGDESSNMEQDGDGDDDGPIPAQLLEPNVEYRIGSEFTPSGESPSAPERFSHHGLPLMHPNPLIDLAKVASTMHSIQHVGGGPNKRRGVPKTRPPPAPVGDNGIDLITSSAGRHSILDPSSPQPPIKIKIKKAQEPIICEICKKKFSNAYNLRVHMEGHSGQVFVCSVCSHASRSRDALRKHFAYRHRELWISGMSAFRKNVPGTTGRKLSISKPNANSISPKMDEDGNIIEEANNNNNNNNNDTLADSKGINNYIRGGGDGTLTISEAFPDQIKAE